MVVFMLKSQTTKTLAISVMLFKVDNWTQRSRSTARDISYSLILLNVSNICKGFRVQSVFIFYSYIYAYARNSKVNRIPPLFPSLPHKKARKKSGRVGLS